MEFCSIYLRPVPNDVLALVWLDDNLHVKQYGFWHQASLPHIFCKAQDLGCRPVDDTGVLNEGAFALNLGHPARLFYFMQYLSGGGITDLKIFNDVIFGWDPGPGLELAGPYHLHYFQ